MKIAMVVGMIAMVTFAVGLPSASALGQKNGPTPPKLADPVAAGTFTEIDTIFFESAVSGSYTLNVAVQGGPSGTTGSIAFNDPASAVASAIGAVTGSAVSGVGADGTASGLAPYTVEFTGVAGTDVRMTVATSSLVDPDGDADEIIITNIQDGATTTSDDIAPHGGYSALTDYCLQCHQIHSSSNDPAGEYALMAQSSVTSTCATCHGYLGASPTGATDPGFVGVEGTASQRAVYTSNPIHTIGATSSRAESNWTYGGWGGFAPGSITGPMGPSNTDLTTPPTHRGTAGTASAYGGGFYCGSCHTPHGEFGQLINAKWAVTTADQTGGSTPTSTEAVVPWVNNTRIYWNNPATVAEDWAMMYLWQASPGDPWQVCTATGGGGTCYDAQVNDSEGQLVSLYGYKLLSYVPNHQYPVYVPGSGYKQSDGTFSALPPGGEYADGPYQAGVLSTPAGQPTGSTNSSGNCPVYGGGPPATTAGPCPTLSTNSGLGALGADISSAATSFSVTSSSATLGFLAAPFKIRIDNEVMMVTNKAPASGGSGTSFTLTVTRNTENPDAPWTNGTAAAHTAGTTVNRMPTILVDETGFGVKAGNKPPFHIKFGTGVPTNNESTVVLARTLVSGSTYLYTVGRAVDSSPQNESHLAGATILVQGGTSVATVKSWGVDIYDHDMATWCGTCHTGMVDVKFGGQYHSHPTGCTACHGNPADNSSNDFPHSSTSEVLLKEVPDALCVECHAAGTLP